LLNLTIKIYETIAPRHFGSYMHQNPKKTAKNINLTGQIWTGTMPLIADEDCVAG